MTILIVDDYVQVREVMRLMLEGRGYTVLMAEDGDKALRLFAGHDVDVAFIDMDMPRMTGLEVCRSLLHHAAMIDEQLAVWLMTGVMRPDLTADAARAGALGVLAKPFTTAELIARITATCAIPPEIGATPPQLAGHRAQLAHNASVENAGVLTGSRTFLVVDDNDDNRFLTAHALRKRLPGSQVIACATVEEALQACHNTKFDGVLTDHHLGDQDGPAFMAQLRSAGVQCPVVVITGSSDPTVHARAYAAGASRVFYGPEMDFAGYFRRTLATSTQGFV